MFVIASVIHFLGVGFYAIFASGELQPWAEPKEEDAPALGAAPAWNPFDSQQKPQYNGEQNYSTTVSRLRVLYLLYLQAHKRWHITGRECCVREEEK